MGQFSYFECEEFLVNALFRLGAYGKERVCAVGLDSPSYRGFSGEGYNDEQPRRFPCNSGSW